MELAEQPSEATEAAGGRDGGAVGAAAAPEGEERRAEVGRQRRRPTRPGVAAAPGVDGRAKAEERPALKGKRGGDDAELR